VPPFSRSVAAQISQFGSTATPDDRNAPWRLATEFNPNEVIVLKLDPQNLLHLQALNDAGPSM
jgi:hypothetical protein